MKRTIFLILLLSLYLNQAFAGSANLKAEIRQIVKPYDACVGVAVRNLQNGDGTTLHGNKYFPLQSVYKFHLALAVLHEVDKGHLNLDQSLHLNPDDLLPDTWSPLREHYPEGNVDLPLREILNYTIAQSDNNGCDILFRLIGGTSIVENYLRDIGIRKTDVRFTEEEMSWDWQAQFSNRATPGDAVKALDVFYNGSILKNPTYDYLWGTLTGTITGANRLKGQLPAGTIVAHKTGTSARGEDGRRTAVNDLGIIILSNGQAIAIAVFITDTAEDDATNDLIIARIAKAVWDHYTNY